MVANGHGAGLDYGVRRIAYACPGTQTAKEFTIPASRRDDPRNWHLMARVLMDMVDEIEGWLPGLVAVEAPIEGRARNVQTAVRMGGAFGALVTQLIRCKVPVVLTVAPSSWKKEICGFGSADKDDVARWLAWSAPDLSAACISQDGVDAMVLGMYADLALTRQRKENDA